MIQEKNITLVGKEVRMRYCAAAETGYEQLSGKSIDVFLPTVTKDDEGSKVTTPPSATRDDYIKLAYAAITAAYSRAMQEQPVTANELLFDASPREIADLISAVVELRLAWYDIPEVMDTGEKGDDDPNS